MPEFSLWRWPLLHAGVFDDSARFAAAHADVVFAMAPSDAHARKLREDLREQAPRNRRDRAPKALPGLSHTLAKNRTRAEELAASALAVTPAHARHWHMVGNSADAIREIATRTSTSAIDSFITLPLGLWESLKILFDDVIPALQNRGIVRTDFSVPAALATDESPGVRRGEDT